MGNNKQINECLIYGLKCNGVSVMVSRISIDTDQSPFDYICNVCPENFDNGNGSYDVSIVNKDLIPGMPIGKWRLKSAWVTFNWGESAAKLVMEDADGYETKEITSAMQKGSRSGFDLPSLVSTIFTKAQEIVRDYPNARVYNSLMELKAAKKGLDSQSLTIKYKATSDLQGDEFVYLMENFIERTAVYIKAFKQASNLLKEHDDMRSVARLKEITSECKSFLQNLKMSV